MYNVNRSRNRRQMAKRYSSPTTFSSDLGYQVFACKVIRRGREVSLEDVDAEKRAVEKVCMKSHQNIVKVFRHWEELWDNVPTYIIQMELCDGDLDSYLKQQRVMGDTLK